MDDLAWLGAWFAEAATNWDHSHGIEIHSVYRGEPGSVEPLGWTVKINLKGTIAEGCPFASVEERRHAHDFVVCQVYDWPEEDGGRRFEGWCGTRNLRETLRIFRDWIESLPGA